MVLFNVVVWMGVVSVVMEFVSAIVERSERKGGDDFIL